MGDQFSGNESDQIRGHRLKISPVCDMDLVDYEELYDELFSRMEQGVGAQLRAVGENKGDGGDV